MVAELLDLHMVCLLKVVTPGWVTRTVSFTLVIDYTRYCGSFAVLQAKAKITEDDAVILDSHQDPTTLLSLEAVYIKRKKPILNTKDEFKSHTLQYAF